MSAYLSEDTSMHPGGCTPCGYNGSLTLYRHPPRDCCKPSPARRAAMAAVRERLVVRAAETARRQAKG